MMMKRWAVALGVTIMGSVSYSNEAPKINEVCGGKGTTYSVKEIPYDEAVTSRVNEIIKSYHLGDQEALKIALPHHNNNLEDYKTYLDTEIQKSAARFSTGEARLLSISKNGELVGGAYFSVEQDGKIVRMQQTGFKAGLPLMELAIPQQKMIDSLASKKYFPIAEFLVVFLRLNSKIVETILLSLKFKRGAYKSADYPITEYQAYERSCI